jgi:NADH-quinone oxidoreductase subunit G
VIDLCPVGALTSKPYAFNARPWELTKTESVDVMDAVGSAIRVDSRGREVLRILPRLNEDVNEEWISDKTRFAVDGLKRQRLDRPMSADGKLRAGQLGRGLRRHRREAEGWGKHRRHRRRPGLRESMFALKDLMAALGSPTSIAARTAAHSMPSARVYYLFNTTIAGIEEADAILLIGTNPRRKRRWSTPASASAICAGGLQGRAIGPEADLTYPVEMLGDGPASTLRHRRRQIPSPRC